MEVIPMKTCKKCRLSFELSQFSPKPSNKDGYHSFCESCEILATAKQKLMLAKSHKEWVKNHPEQNRKIAKRYRQNNLEKCRQKDRVYFETHREQRKERDRIYYIKNRKHHNMQTKACRQKRIEEYRARDRAYHHKNKERLNAISRAYSKSHRAELRQGGADAASRRRARIHSAANIEKIDREAIYDRDRGICHICHRKVSRKSFTLDHLIPIIHHGDHTALNLAVAHHRCNCRRFTGIIPAQLRLLG
jgi:HNH endonuclease